MTVFRIVTADVVCWNSCFNKQEQVGWLCTLSQCNFLYEVLTWITCVVMVAHGHQTTTNEKEWVNVNCCLKLFMQFKCFLSLYLKQRVNNFSSFLTLNKWTNVHEISWSKSSQTLKFLSFMSVCVCMCA